jgi:hypothetical protein
VLGSRGPLVIIRPDLAILYTPFYFCFVLTFFFLVARNVRSIDRKQNTQSPARPPLFRYIIATTPGFSYPALFSVAKQIWQIHKEAKKFYHNFPDGLITMLEKKQIIKPWIKLNQQF